MTNRLVINKFYGGISNDPNIGGVGSLSNAENVEIRENSKQVMLVKGNNTYSKLHASNSYNIMGYNVYDNTHLLRIHKNGYVTSFIEGDLTSGDYVVNLGEPIYNIGNLTTNAGNRGFIFGASKCYKWNYDGTNYYSLGMYEENSVGVVTNGDFSSATGWTVGANWSITGGLATHTAGSTAVLSQTLTVTNATTYRIEVITSGVIASTCVVKMGGATIGTINATNQILVGNRTTTSTSELLEFEPATGFTGSLDNVKVQVYNVTSQSQTFNEKAPYIIIGSYIYVGNGNKITEIDTTTDTWVYSTVLTIDLDYTIKGITKIGEQIFVYASNGNSSRQYLWDGVNTTVDRTITWVDKNIVNVASFANQDYVITTSAYSNKSGLWLVNGYQLQDIYANPANSNTNGERIYFDANYTNAIETIGKLLLIPGSQGVYTYGNFTPGLPTSLSQDFKHLIGYTTAMYYSETTSYQLRVASYGTIDNSAGVYESLIQFNAYNNSINYTGFIELNPITGETVSNRKDLEKITIGYKLETNTSINVYTKNLDRTTKYASIYYNDTTLPAIGDTYTSGGNTYTITAINDLTGKCILHTTYTGTGTTTNGTFTRTSGAGDSTFYTNKIRFGYKYLGNLNDITVRRETINESEEFYNLYIGIELLTTSTSVTPILNDVTIYYGETNND